MDFFSGPNEGLSFHRVNDSIQRLVLIIAPNPLLIPLSQEDVALLINAPFAGAADLEDMGSRKEFSPFPFPASSSESELRSSPEESSTGSFDGAALFIPSLRNGETRRR
uniref:Uncharacterized protein n=1 Tax=Aegilops tauschii TaxID=37682 RepID=R7W5U2_AEGTA